MALYDLLLQGGRTYDPETRTFAREDVAVREGKIVLRAAEIPSESAALVLDAQGCVVSPCFPIPGRIPCAPSAPRST